MAAYFFFDMREVLDQDKLATYRKGVLVTVELYGGRYLTVGGQCEVVEGEWRPIFPVIIEFPNRKQARRWYDSPEYRDLKALRLAATRCFAFFIEGNEFQQRLQIEPAADAATPQTARSLMSARPAEGSFTGKRRWQCSPCRRRLAMAENLENYAVCRAEAVARAFLSRVWRGAGNDLDAIDELMTEDYQIHSAGMSIYGRQAFKEWVRRFQGLLLEARNDILDVFASSAGDKVVARWHCTGRNNGIFGLSPDGRPVAFSGIAIWRMHDGRLAECWIERAALEAYWALSVPSVPCR